MVILPRSRINKMYLSHKYVVRLWLFFLRFGGVLVLELKCARPMQWKPRDYRSFSLWTEPGNSQVRTLCDNKVCKPLVRPSPFAKFVTNGFKWWPTVIGKFVRKKGFKVHRTGLAHPRSAVKRTTRSAQLGLERFSLKLVLRLRTSLTGRGCSSRSFVIR